MSKPLPGRPLHDHPTVGLRSTTPETTSLGEAVDAAIYEQLGENATSYRNPTPVPKVGTAPPVAQPGRPPMSEKATDDSVRMISGGILTLCIGAAVSGILYFSSGANPVVVGCICAAPPAAFLSFKGLVKCAKRTLEAAPPREVHNHYEAPVYQDQRTVHTKTSGVWAKTNNNQ
ncbi:hypothetical protein [Streptomyces lasiicapitis]|uniref:hypothetical protein n=1 Tax=Streptomyces lasiicapitis TaxID=1923961 RepID=UPI003694FF0B